VETAVTPDESQLVRALRAGDEATFTQLVRSYHPALMRVARIYVASNAVAEEVVQETWIAVLNGIARFEGRSSLRTWIFRILANTAKTRAVREGRTIPFSSLRNPAGVPEPAVEVDRFRDPDDAEWPGHWLGGAAPADWGSLPEERLLAGETRAVIEEAIERLPASQRAVISLRDVEGWSSGEVRNVLELSEVNQRVLLHRGRSKVRRALEDYFEGTNP
jgi:RNA polymerase sigma-70 factor (ECF subfamily)